MPLATVLAVVVDGGGVVVVAAAVLPRRERETVTQNHPCRMRPETINFAALQCSKRDGMESASAYFLADG